MPKFSHPLGLSKTEWNVLRGAIHARGLVPNGHFLAGTSKAVANACRSLAKRGYIRRVGPKASGMVTLTPGESWPIVKVTKATVDKYNADMTARPK